MRNESAVSRTPHTPFTFMSEETVEAQKPEHDWPAIAAKLEANGDVENANRIRELIKTSESNPSSFIRDAVKRMLLAPQFFTDQERKEMCDWERAQKEGLQQGVWPTKLGSS